MSQFQLIVGTDEFEASTKPSPATIPMMPLRWEDTEWAPDGSCKACDTCLWHLWNPVRRMPVHCRGNFNHQ